MKKVILLLLFILICCSQIFSQENPIPEPASSTQTEPGDVWFVIPDECINVTWDFTVEIHINTGS